MSVIITVLCYTVEGDILSNNKILIKLQKLISPSTIALLFPKTIKHKFHFPNDISDVEYLF